MVERLADRLAIHECLYRYARSVDRLDYEGIAACYFDDAIDTHGSYTGTAVGLVEDIRSRHQVIDSAQHFVTNVIIEFDGDNLAFVESYCIAFLRMRPEDGQARQAERVSRCRYVDRFERRDGRWAIADRVVVFDESLQVDVQDLSPEDWVMSRRDRSDPVYWWGRDGHQAGNNAPKNETER
ncbi:nuclear transport factor 2 family protein [Dactylosporangium sp. AC04546]|uniref:nuclear transport factor 2 family protein n=1 Tax=Dactylosporangium sp. AC04546 TaxID=2862460 RepID=UPI001EDCCA90|nr:nuclear transport factor 2 family protein [Dactylosporangium sp. AC04546]WVK86438.1 nuclear transport factor 2 family protein [Dactylosporangium sp. AC04546]